MSKYRPPHSRDKISLVDDIEKAFSKKSATLENKVHSNIVNHFVSGLSIKGNKIESNRTNRKVIKDLSRIEGQIFEKETTPFLKWILRRFIDIAVINAKYFRKNSESSVGRVKKQVEANIFSAYGVTKGGTAFTIENGGWLHTLGDFKDPYNKVRQLAFRAVKSGDMDLAEFKQQLKAQILPEGKLGPVRHHLETNAIDAFAEFDRETSKEYATKLGMRAWLYNGGVIDSTRPFCEGNDGEVFIEEEIKAFKNKLNTKNGPQWSTGGYDPFVHLGGHRCRHSLDPISDKVAIRLRSDLIQKWGLDKN